MADILFFGAIIVIIMLFIVGNVQAKRIWAELATPHFPGTFSFAIILIFATLIFVVVSSCFSDNLKQNTELKAEVDILNEDVKSLEAEIITYVQTYLDTYTKDNETKVKTLAQASMLAGMDDNLSDNLYLHDLFEERNEILDKIKEKEQKLLTEKEIEDKEKWVLFFFK